MTGLYSESVLLGFHTFSKLMDLSFLQKKNFLNFYNKHLPTVHSLLSLSLTLRRTYNQKDI